MFWQKPATNIIDPIFSFYFQNIVINFYLTFIASFSSILFWTNSVETQNPRRWFTSQDSRTLLMWAWKDKSVLERDRFYFLYGPPSAPGENNFGLLKGPLGLVKTTPVIMLDCLAQQEPCIVHASPPTKWINQDYLSKVLSLLCHKKTLRLQCVRL